jgi:regulator of sigma E protease
MGQISVEIPAENGSVLSATQHSANLALMNLLPIPVLDGGALLFCAAEMVLRRPLPARAQAFCTHAGVAALATLFMLTTLHDLARTGLFRWLAGL